MQGQNQKVGIESGENFLLQIMVCELQTLKMFVSLGKCLCSMARVGIMMELRHIGIAFLLTRSTERAGRNMTNV